jgi:hypothetical protein
MSDSVLTKIRKALVYQLSQITTANNYLTNVHNVYDEMMALENMKEYPSAIVVMMKDEAKSEEIVTTNKQVVYEVIFGLHEINDMATAKENVIQDVEKRLGIYYMLPSSEGECTCKIARVIESLTYGYKENKPNGLVILKILVEYRQLTQDPTRRQ